MPPEYMELLCCTVVDKDGASEVAGGYPFPLLASLF